MYKRSGMSWLRATPERGDDALDLLLLDKLRIPRWNHYNWQWRPGQVPMVRRATFSDHDNLPLDWSGRMFVLNEHDNNYPVHGDAINHKRAAADVAWCAMNWPSAKILTPNCLYPVTLRPFLNAWRKAYRMPTPIEKHSTAAIHIYWQDEYKGVNIGSLDIGKGKAEAERIINVALDILRTDYGLSNPRLIISEFGTRIPEVLAGWLEAIQSYGSTIANYWIFSRDDYELMDNEYNLTQLGQVWEDYHK